MSFNRRSFILTAGAFAAPVYAQAKPRVIVVGGGAGGATAARYIAKEGGIDVTLIEASPVYTTCFHSNLVLGGFRSFESIQHKYDGLKKAGVRVINMMASSVNKEGKTLRLADGTTLPYDRLILSPGIDLKFDSVIGYSEEVAKTLPHAWRAGEQTQILKKQLDALENGANIVMIAPPNPYRCPPGPYERASMMAHILKTTGKTRSKIIILDTKETFSKKALFEEGWAKHYPGMIEWQDPKMHGGIKGVDAASMTVKTDLADYKAGLINVIPAQWAGAIARTAGLTNASGYCPIDAASMRSMVNENIFVLGDAAIAGDMPKSAFSANSQAKVVAMTVRADILKTAAFPARYSNTCWSLLTTDDTIKIGGGFEAKDGKITSTTPFISKAGETADMRKDNQVENMGWYAGITADIFG
jgi:sulfide dehydrogenase [flavocytochrome c] flavoprotein chain